MKKTIYLILGLLGGLGMLTCLNVYYNCHGVSLWGLGIMFIASYMLTAISFQLFDEARK
jgi:hypothetical protein